MNKYICDIKCINEKAVKAVKEKLMKKEDVEKIVNSFKVLNDPTRLKILFSLSLNELCVCDLSYILELSQSSISHQLAVLRMFCFVKFRREGKIIYYSLKDKRIINLIKTVAKHGGK